MSSEAKLGGAPVISINFMNYYLFPKGNHATCDYANK